MTNSDFIDQFFMTNKNVLNVFEAQPSLLDVVSEVFRPTLIDSFTVMQTLKTIMFDIEATKNDVDIILDKLRRFPGLEATYEKNKHVKSNKRWEVSVLLTGQ